MHKIIISLIFIFTFAVNPAYASENYPFAVPILKQQAMHLWMLEQAQ